MRVKINLRHEEKGSKKDNERKKPYRSEWELQGSHRGGGNAADNRHSERD